jgi:hypothetical protein
MMVMRKILVAISLLFLMVMPAKAADRVEDRAIHGGDRL